MENNNREFFKKICTLWDEGENHSTEIDSLYKYYTGENFANPADSYFLKEKRTPLNIISQIVDAKHSNVLDAQFDSSVVPEIYNFDDMKSIHDLQDVANVLNTALKDVLKKNEEYDLKERVLKWGFIKRGNTQVEWDTTGEQGQIRINLVDPRTIRYTKGAKDVKDLTMVGYSVDLDVAVVKRNYARMSDGSFDIELCKKIDEASGVKIENGEKGSIKAVAPYSVEAGAGLAYVREGSSKGVGKTITIVVMFLFDGTMEAPSEDDSQEDTALEQEMRLMYPNGRMVMFVPDKEKELILRDEQSPEAFKSLGNIDFLLLNKFDGFNVQSTVERLTAIQERINGTVRKLRTTVGGNINCSLFDERMRGVVEDNAFVNLPIIFIEGLGDFQPPTLNNGGIDQAMKLRELLESYKQDAYEQERVNRAWISGENQTNVQSGDHAEALNESAMSSIRSIQRTFKDFWISMCEKVVALIIENYSEQRLIEIGTGFSAKQYAMFDTETIDGEEQRNIKFIDEAGRIARIIKIDPNWKFKVEVTSGTDIPRTRRENARLVDEVAASPIMQSGDIDMIDMYLTAKDFPNRHAVVEMLKKKLDAKAKQPMTIMSLLANPQVATAASNLFKSFAGFSQAQGKLLESIGLPGNTDTLTDAPAQQVFAKSSAKDIAIIAPQQISANPMQAKFGHEQSTDLEIAGHMSKHESKPMPEEASNEVPAGVKVQGR